MSESMLEVVWESLERLVVAMEQPGANHEQVAQALRGVLQQVLELPPEQVVAKAEGSFLPARPLISWLVFETSRLQGADQAKVEALRQCWEASRPGQGIIPPAPWLVSV